MRKTLELHLDVAVVAVLCGGMGKAWVRSRIKSGDFDGYLMGNKTVVSASSVNRYLERVRITGQPKEMACTTA